MQICSITVIRTALHKSSFRKLLRYGRKGNDDLDVYHSGVHRTARESCAHWATLHATSTAKGNSLWAVLDPSPARSVQRPLADGSLYIPPRGEAPFSFHLPSSRHSSFSFIPLIHSLSLFLSVLMNKYNTKFSHFLDIPTSKWSFSTRGFFAVLHFSRYHTLMSFILCNSFYTQGCMSQFCKEIGYKYQKYWV